jgi:hypothetical protein
MHEIKKNKKIKKKIKKKFMILCHHCRKHCQQPNQETFLVHTQERWKAQGERVKGREMCAPVPQLALGRIRSGFSWQKSLPRFPL